jgi:hypothetical protein
LGAKKVKLPMVNIQGIILKEKTKKNLKKIINNKDESQSDSSSGDEEE